MIKLILYKNQSESNLKLSIKGFIPEFHTETYWFNQFLLGKGKKLNQDLLSFLKHNLSVLEKFVKNMEINQKVFYPYDLSDQHIGFIAIKKINKNMLNCYIIHSISLCADDISPIFDPILKLKEDDSSIILGGELIHLDKFSSSIEVVD